MHRLLFIFLLFVAAGLPGHIAAQAGAAEGLPPRPTPFRFVNDQAQLLEPADAKKLESGLRRYADNTGTQVVVVTVPSLGGRTVADYGRALGTAWSVGQRNKNNGLVVLISAQERKVTIQPGSGLASTITPAVTSRVIGEMAPKFKQGNYFAGLRTGLNTLMATANPSSAPKNEQPADAASPSAAPAAGVAAGAAENSLSQNEPARIPSTDPLLAAPPTEPVSSGPGMGTVLIGGLLVGGLLWLVVKMLRRRSAANNTSYPGPGTPNANAAPNFLPNRNGPGGGYGPGGNYPNQGPGYGGAPNSGGMGMGGMGGILATGAAAAAGAYLGNRMASGHETSGNGLAGDGPGASHFDPNAAAGAAGAVGTGAAGTGAAEGYFAGRDGGADSSGPDYFSGDDPAGNSSDYFSADDNSSYDDTSSDDTGGGGFDSNDDNSGSW